MQQEQSKYLHHARVKLKPIQESVSHSKPSSQYYQKAFLPQRHLYQVQKTSILGSHPQHRQLVRQTNEFCHNVLQYVQG
jgi:hypothetical protein